MRDIFAVVDVGRRRKSALLITSEEGEDLEIAISGTHYLGLHGSLVRTTSEGKNGG